jgi:predicted porin
MMKKNRVATLSLIASGTMFTAPAWAQSSVTLYGIVDESIAYQSSQAALGANAGGRSNVKVLSGVWAGSRFGLKGSEDLGGGSKAIFGSVAIRTVGREISI